MYFEAKTKGKKYKIDVTETSSHWEISLQEEGQERVFYNLNKKNHQTAEKTISLLFKNKSYLIDVIKKDTKYEVYTRGSYRTITMSNDEMLLHESLKKEGRLSLEKTLKSDMPGKIISVSVKEGQQVKAGDPLIVMEAMKMENEIRSSSDAKIKKIYISGGDAVEKNSLLLEFE